MRERITKLNEARARALTQARELADAADAAQRSMSAEEAQRFDALMADFDRDTAERNRLEALTTRTEQAETVRRDVRLLPGGDRVVQTTDITDEAQAYRSAFLDYLRYGSQGMEPEQRAILRRGFRTDKEDRTTSGQSKGTTTLGGFLVPTGFFPQMLEHMVQAGAMRQTRATVLTTEGGEDLPVPKTTAHGAATWVAEQGAFIVADETLGQITLKAYKAGRIIKVSEELLQDSAIDLEAYLAREAGRSIGALENAGYLTGGGTTVPTGISTVSTLGKAGATGQATSIIADDLIDLFYSVNQTYRRLGEWLLNDASIGIISKLKNANDDYIWRMGLQVGEPDRLMGRPVFSDPDMPTMAASAESVLFGDLSTYYIRDVAGATFRRLDEIYAGTGEVGFRVHHRTDGNLIDLSGAVKHYSNSAT